MKTLMTTIPSKKIAIIITAAGSSVRMGGKKKEFLPLNSGTVLSSCALAFYKAFQSKDSFINQFQPIISDFVITIPAGMQEAAKKALLCDSNFSEKDFNIHFVVGSSTRQSSIFNALKYLYKEEKHPDYVLIHDGARPFVTEEIIQKVTFSAIEFGAAAPGFTPTDTIKQIDEEGFICQHLIRKDLISIQTPQAFEFESLYKAHSKAADEEFEYTDDTEIWGKYCGRVKITDGNPSNIKITYPEDLLKFKNS